MGRLVDASNLNFQGQNYNKSQMKAILDFIDAQPTAYDVEKVVAVLQECSDKYKNTSSEYEQGKAFAYKNAIDIVKRGGAE